MIYTLTLNPARDRSLVIDSFTVGAVNRASSVRDDAGGKGINVSKVIQALGGSSVAMGIVGGETGAFIEKSLDAMGISHRFVHSKHETRTNIKISDPSRGQTTDINERGQLDPEDARDAFDMLLASVNEGDAAVIAGRMDAQIVDLASWIGALKAKGARVFLDTEGEALRLGCGAGPYFVKPNEEELIQLTGCAPRGEEELAWAALKLTDEKGVSVAALSRGEKGALFACEGKVYACAGLKVNAVSTVGAGDAMTAAWAYAYESKMGFEEACALSVAASAAAVTMPGTLSPNLEDINRLLKQVEIRRIK